MSRIPPVLLLHGQPGSPEDWRWVILALDGRAETIAPLRPGYDGTPPGGVRHSAEAGVATLDRLGIERAVVVGHSYGGAVAAWMAASFPERVAGLVLVSAAANRAALVPGDRLLAAPVIGPLASAGMLWSTGLMLQVPPLRRRVAWAGHLPADYLAAEGRRSLSLSLARTFLVEQRWMLRELPELEDTLSTIVAPTQVIVGDEDPFVPPDAGRALAEQIPDAELIEVRHGGHVVNVTHPEVVAEAILTAGRADLRG